MNRVYPRFFTILMVTLVLTPFNLTFFDGGVLFDRDPSVLRNGITIPISFFIMLILLLFNNNTYKSDS